MYSINIGDYEYREIVKLSCFLLTRFSLNLLKYIYIYIWMSGWRRDCCCDFEYAYPEPSSKRRRIVQEFGVGIVDPSNISSCQDTNFGQ